MAKLALCCPRLQVGPVRPVVAEEALARQSGRVRVAGGVMEVQQSLLEDVAVVGLLAVAGLQFDVEVLALRQGHQAEQVDCVEALEGLRAGDGRGQLPQHAVLELLVDLDRVADVVVGGVEADRLERSVLVGGEMVEGVGVRLLIGPAELVVVVDLAGKCSARRCGTKRRPILQAPMSGASLPVKKSL